MSVQRSPRRAGFSRRSTVGATLVMGALTAIPLYLLGGAAVLTTFTNGEVADADTINANFQALNDAITSSASGAAEMVDLHTHSSFGTDTGTIDNTSPRFSGETTNDSGVVIQYDDNAGAGATFTALQRCLVDISYTAAFTNPVAMAIIVDGSTTENLDTLGGAVRAYSSTNSSGHSETVSYSGILQPNQVIRAYAEYGGTSPSSPGRHRLSVRAVGLPSVASAPVAEQTSDVDYISFFKTENPFVRAGQSFTPDANGSITSVSLSMDTTGSPTGFIIGELFAADATTLIQAAGAPVDIAATIPASPTLITWTFSTPVPVTGGTVYYFMVRPSGTNLSTANFVNFYGTNSNSYFGGNFRSASTDFPAVDLAFEVTSP